MFKKYNNNFYPSPVFDGEETVVDLPPGFYEIGVHSDGMSKSSYFRTYKPTGKLIPFEGKYKGIEAKIMKFFEKDTIELYSSLGFNHLLGCLFYGRPGTGKSSFIKYVCKALVKLHGAICIYIQDHSDLGLIHHLIKAARGKEKTTPVVVIFEEIHEFVGYASNVSLLGSILDGFRQIENVCFMTTTNYINKIPVSLRNRPSRISIIEEFDQLDRSVIEGFILHELKGLTEGQLKRVKDNLEVGEIIHEVHKSNLPIDYAKHILLDMIAYSIPLKDALEKATESYKTQITQES